MVSSVLVEVVYDNVCSRGISISTSFIVRGVSEGDFSRFCITSFVCNIVILPSLGY